LISGPLVLGVRPNLKVDGVALFLGNTLSLNTMVSEPIVKKTTTYYVENPGSGLEQASNVAGIHQIMGIIGSQASDRHVSLY
jgi:hypothetical protein